MHIDAIWLGVRGTLIGHTKPSYLQREAVRDRVNRICSKLAIGLLAISANAGERSGCNPIERVDILRTCVAKQQWRIIRRERK
jgi:hypothetical protein